MPKEEPETAQTADFAATLVDSRLGEAPRVDASVRGLVAFGPTKSTAAGTIEDALARGIEGAVTAGRWDVVAQPRSAHDPNSSACEPSLAGAAVSLSGLQ